MGYPVSTPECYVFSDNNRNDANNILAMLPSLLQRQGVDPTLIAMCNRGGAFGNNGLSDIIALIVIAAIFGNGNFGGGLFGNRNGGCALPNMINNDSNTQLLMQMLQRNGADIQSLANMTNTSADAITAAINSVSKEICNFATATGQNFNQALTAIMQGDNALQTQLANCCCTLRDAITQQGYQSQLGQKDIQNSMLTGFGQTQVGMERGFSQIGYQMATDTCGIKQNATDNTGRILAKLDQIEDSRKDREIASLTAQLATVNARAERAAELAPITQKLNDILCKQPNTVTVPYQPFVTVPNCVAWQTALYGGYPFANGGNFG